MAYTNTACPTVNRNRVSNSFFGLVLSRKFSPVNLDRNMPKYTILPVPIKIDQTATTSEKNMPINPIMVQTRMPANGVARNFLLENSMRCSSNVLFIYFFLLVTL